MVISAFAIQNVIPEWPLNSPLYINDFKGLLMPLFIISAGSHANAFERVHEVNSRKEVQFLLYKLSRSVMFKC